MATFNKEGNAFTFGFAAIMVVVVGAALALAFEVLKPYQQTNVEQKKMQDILGAVLVKCERHEAPGLFDEYVKQQVVIDSEGNVKESQIIAFQVDVQKEYRAKSAGIMSEKDMNFPLFICEKESKTYYVLPMVGKGLWGPVWGYISLEDDFNTVYGVTFDHKTETPGLGAEIKYEPFQLPFRGKKILDSDGKFVSIKVMKGGAPDDFAHGVDAITGGTITSNGVSEMIDRTTRIYLPYFNNKKNNG